LIIKEINKLILRYQGDKYWNGCNRRIFESQVEIEKDEDLRGTKNGKKIHLKSHFHNSVLTPANLHVLLRQHRGVVHPHFPLIGVPNSPAAADLQHQVDPRAKVGANPGADADDRVRGVGAGQVDRQVGAAGDDHLVEGDDDDEGETHGAVIC
jgi:hypothetical protein